MIKQFQNEMQALMNRSVDRHLRLAVTGLSRSGKTAFITALVNQLLSVNSGARLPLFSPVREERLLGVRRVPQQDMGVARFTYDEGLAQLYGTPPAWPTRRAASVKSVSRCATARVSHCCATSKTPPRCGSISSIILANGCWIYRCSRRIT